MILLLLLIRGAIAERYKALRLSKKRSQARSGKMRRPALIQWDTTAWQDRVKKGRGPNKLGSHDYQPSIEQLEISARSFLIKKG